MSLGNTNHNLLVNMRLVNEGIRPDQSQQARFEVLTPLGVFVFYSPGNESQVRLPAKDRSTDAARDVP